MATILGTFQSTMTDFRYLRKVWQKNTEEERLLGVSLTGIMDNQILSGKSSTYGMNIGSLLEELRDVAVETNRVFAQHLGIAQSTAITCVKPSGTVSQLVDSASGIHARHNPHYVRTVRGDNKDPLTQFLMSQGIPAEPDVMKPESTTVFSFPMKAPSGAVTRTEMTAIENLNYGCCINVTGQSINLLLLYLLKNMSGWMLVHGCIKTLMKYQVLVFYHLMSILINKHPIKILI